MKASPRLSIQFWGRNCESYFPPLHRVSVITSTNVRSPLHRKWSAQAFPANWGEDKGVRAPSKWERFVENKRWTGPDSGGPFVSAQHEGDQQLRGGRRRVFFNKSQRNKVGLSGSQRHGAIPPITSLGGIKALCFSLPSHEWKPERAYRRLADYKV